MRTDTATQDSRLYALEEMTTGGKGKPDTYADIDPSESQERIFGGPKAEAHVTTTNTRSGSTSSSEGLALQGITVTTDVKVVRD